jgi:ZIP family zinc transporter
MVATRNQRSTASKAGFNVDEVDIATPPRRNGRHAATVVNADVKLDDAKKRISNNKETATNNNTKASNTDKVNDDVDEEAESKYSERRSYCILLILAIITYILHPSSSWYTNATSTYPAKPTLHTVFYYGWVSAVSTGLGVLPLCFVTTMKEYWIGVSNAIAAGMMCAASYSLFVEGCTFHDVNDTSSFSPILRTALGCILGLLFILSTKNFLDTHEENASPFGSLSGADTRKILLIIFVMTLHSFSEGVGIGVSFGGEHGHDFGVFISASLAVHNVPEGLAVAIVLLPRKVSKATAAIWCIVTSLPQPIMAVPAFMFVHSFLPLLPVGLGFAGGAMMWVAFMELLLEAYEDTDLVTTGVVSTTALGVMLLIQRSIGDA